MNSKKVHKSLRFIDSWLDFKWRTSEVPGYIVAISHKGKVIFNNAYGFANLEKKEKLTKDHIFRIASQSKTFTATAIMQLIEQGKISLDDKIVDYLPWLNEHNDKRFQSITIKHLLSHGAGVIRDGLDADYWELKKPFPNEAQFKKEILVSNLILNSNKHMKYSNFGYTLLGLIIEQASGKSYKDFITANIIQPLDLQNTGVDYTKAIENKLATGYSRANEDKKRLPIANVDTNSMSSATGFYSTTEDLCKYFNAQIIGSNQLLKDSSKKEMQTEVWRVKNTEDKRKYGLGFIITPIGKRTVFGHSGGFPGQITNSMCDPKNDLVVVVLINCIDGPAREMAKGIISVIDYFDNNYTLKTQDTFGKFEGRFMNLWAINDVISMGNKIVSVSPETWTPFKNPEKLAYVNDTTLKVVKTEGFYSEGELVHYNFDQKNHIKSVIYTGTTMLPEKTYLSEQKKLRIVEI